MEIGIIGLPNVGKSTLFNALTKLSVPTDKFPFTTVEPNVGVVPLPDPRLEFLGSIFKPKKVTPATVKFIDIAGLVKGAHQGLGLGNKFLAHIRRVDALIQVIRIFLSPDIPNVLEKISPEEERDIIATELMLADLDVAIRAKEKIERSMKSGVKCESEKCELLKKIIDGLNNSIPIMKQGPVSEIIKEYNFLTAKPILYLLNIDDKIEQKNFNIDNSLVLDVKLEYELIGLPKNEQEEIRQGFGYEKSIDDLIIMAFKMLNLVIFYTVVGDEVRAWTLKNGENVKTAAGKIHTDMARGFICAQVYSFDDLKTYGLESVLHEKGLIRTEGKDYIVKDGDIIKIKFQV